MTINNKIFILFFSIDEEYNAKLFDNEINKIENYLFYKNGNDEIGIYINFKNHNKLFYEIIDIDDNKICKDLLLYHNGIISKNQTKNL